MLKIQFGGKTIGQGNPIFLRETPWFPVDIPLPCGKLTKLWKLTFFSWVIQLFTDHFQYSSYVSHYQSVVKQCDRPATWIHMISIPPVLKYEPRPWG